MSTAVVSAFADAYRDYVVAGDASSGVHEPTKATLRELGETISEAINSLSLGGAIEVVYATLSELEADLAHDADTLALVYDDSTATNNDIYIKLGASGAGSWEPTTILYAEATRQADRAEAAAEVCLLYTSPSPRD